MAGEEEEDGGRTWGTLDSYREGVIETKITGDREGARRGEERTEESVRKGRGI